jgi:myosin heavy subunit
VSDGERSFHVFYQMCAAAGEMEMQRAVEALFAKMFGFIAWYM